MGRGHAHERPSWGTPRPTPFARLASRLRAALGRSESTVRHGLEELPLALRRSELAAPYLEAERAADHRRAAAAAASAMERAATERAWWPADVWGHRALWHFEQAGMTLHAARQARRIGDLRSAAGDPESARRYYAEAIDEARDIGAEHEQGLAALGLGHALLELGDVTRARRLAGAAENLLDRAGARPARIEDARRLRGSEVAVADPGSKEDGA